MVCVPPHCVVPSLVVMEHIAGVAGETSYTAAETGRALLEAMSVEEPFKLLSALPRRLEELRAIQCRREPTEVGQPVFSLSGLLNSAQGQLVGEIALNQSQNLESISSGQYHVSSDRPRLSARFARIIPNWGMERRAGVSAGLPHPTRPARARRYPSIAGGPLRGICFCGTLVANG